jgi:hypothetical protein
VTPSTTPAPAPAPTPAPSGGGAEAEQTVRAYWKTLAAGDYSGAYDYLDPAARQSRSTWISLRQGDGLYSANLTSLAATSTTSSTATVSVDLVTKQSSCRTQYWSGGVYNLVRGGDGWLIHDHHFANKPSC